MASVMEKDVLIEMLAHVVAGIALTTGDKAELTKLANYREELYRTSPEELDFALWVERLKGYSTHENALSVLTPSQKLNELLLKRKSLLTMKKAMWKRNSHSFGTSSRRVMRLRLAMNAWPLC